MGTGLVVLENRLKPDSAEVLAELASAAVRTIMVTGTNIFIHHKKDAL